MITFKSAIEKRYWIGSLVVTITIFLTLFIGKPLQDLFRNQDVQAIIFVAGMLLVGILMLINGIRKRPKKHEVLIWLGLVAVYVMLFLRLGLPERSHLIEYSVLAVFIHNALIERNGNGSTLKIALLAFLLAFIIGVVDECLQLLIPHRVFDPYDIIFNGFAASAAISSHLILQRIRNRSSKS